MWFDFSKKEKHTFFYLKENKGDTCLKGSSIGKHRRFSDPIEQFITSWIAFAKFAATRLRISVAVSKEGKQEKNTQRKTV